MCPTHMEIECIKHCTIMLTYPFIASLVGDYDTIHALHFKGLHTRWSKTAAFSTKGGSQGRLLFKTPPTLQLLSFYQPSLKSDRGNSHQSRFSPDFHIPYGTLQASQETSAGTNFGCVTLRWVSLRCCGFFLCFMRLDQLPED